MSAQQSGVAAPARTPADPGATGQDRGARICPVCRYRPEPGAGEAPELFCPRDGAYLVDPLDLEAAADDPLLGRRVAEFAIVARIGTGGMGSVYRAIQTGVDREVALKVLRSDLADDPQVVQRFLQEARATARLQHRNLVVTYTSGSTPDGLYYIAMEYIAGPSLADVIRESWRQTEHGAVFRLPRSRAMQLFVQITSALSHAHRLGIVHRDLKPENVLLATDEEDGEQAKVVDFGIAKILQGREVNRGALVRTDANTNLGTALYMAPERFAGAPGDPRLDVYALGLLLHELCTGLLPFSTSYDDRERPMGLLHKRLTAPAPPLILPPSDTGTTTASPQLIALHSDLLDREPLRRPASAGEVRERLREVPEAVTLAPALDRAGIYLSAISADVTMSDPPETDADADPAERSKVKVKTEADAAGETGLIPVPKSPQSSTADVPVGRARRGLFVLIALAILLIVAALIALR